MSGLVPGSVDDDDPLTDPSPPGVLWTRVNFVEATPGVLTPANWSFYGRLMDGAGRLGMADLGVIPRSATAVPDDVAGRMFAVFHGHPVINVGVVRAIMGGLPGVTGDDIERDMLGAVRPGVVDESYGRRLPAVLAKLPPRLVRIRRTPAALRADTGRWWSARVDAGGPDTAGLRPGVDPQAALAEAMVRFGAAIRLQARGRLFLQGAASSVSRYAEQVGEPALAGLLMAGAGGSAGVEEVRVADDLYALAGGTLELPAFLARHGFHGPNAGNVDARSWREDPAPVLRLLPTLRAAASPADRRAHLGPARDRAVATLLAGLTGRDRLGARAALRLGPVAAASLEHTKAAMLQSVDVGRAAIRGIGAELYRAGRLDDPEDAFQFFAEELLGPGRADLRERAARRRAARRRYLDTAVPDSWVGRLEPTARSGRPEHGPGTAARPSRVTGLGVGTGVVEGPVRVVLDPADHVEVEAGDILVCPSTDPSWVGLMTVAGGLVIDIGGAVSHGAVVAREIGIPCVIGTRTGTTDLRDGDRVRVDGLRGVVEILEPTRRTV